MDNASKALIMVGAILIAVMLISLGVYLFTYARDKAQDTTENMDAMTTSAFNQQFTSYLGTNIKGTSVKALISLVKATKGGTHPITLAPDANMTASSIVNNHTYTVTESYDTNGYISTITIKDNNSSASST